MSYTAEQLEDYKKDLDKIIKEFCSCEFLDKIKMETDRVWEDPEIGDFLKVKNIKRNEMDSFILTFCLKYQNLLEVSNCLEYLAKELKQKLNDN